MPFEFGQDAKNIEVAIKGLCKQRGWKPPLTREQMKYHGYTETISFRDMPSATLEQLASQAME